MCVFRRDSKVYICIYIKIWRMRMNYLKYQVVSLKKICTIKIIYIVIYIYIYVYVKKKKSIYKMCIHIFFFKNINFISSY